MRDHYKPISLFAGLFSQTLQRHDARELAAQLREAMPEFNLDPVFPNVPNNAPPEVPRFVLFSEGRLKILECAFSKIHLRWNQHGEAQSIDEWFPDFIDLVNETIERTSDLGFQFNRAGLVVTLFRPFRESANQAIVDYFFRPNSLFGEGMREAQLNVHTLVTPPAGPRMNRWIRLRSMRNNQDGKDNGLQVEVDINMVAEDRRLMEPEQIENFLWEARRHVEHDIEFLNDEGF